eukprot:6191649-Pleurochrysis_carterae.AAC.3
MQLQQQQPRRRLPNGRHSGCRTKRSGCRIRRRWRRARSGATAPTSPTSSPSRSTSLASIGWSSSKRTPSADAPHSALGPSLLSPISLAVRFRVAASLSTRPSPHRAVVRCPARDELGLAVLACVAGAVGCWGSCVGRAERACVRHASL